MNDKQNPLIKDPLNAVSSGENVSSAGAETIGKNAEKKSIADISLPEGYDENKLVLLPVNAHTQHFYWDISDEAIERKIASRECRVIIRLYYIVNDKRQEVESIYSSLAKGNYYAYHTPNMLEMEAVLFISDKNGERALLTSNRVLTPSNGMHATPWEIWMTKDGKQHKLESRQSDLAAPELTNPSSLDLVLQGERLKARIGDMFAGESGSDHLSSWNMSSDSLVKKNKK